MTATAALVSVRAQIARACKDANRNSAEVTLVAVSKTFVAEAIEPVIEAGQRVFGENRVQEAKGKWPALMQKHPGIELHLIGPLQSNKAKEAVALFDAIHSVDRDSLCEALAKEIAAQKRAPLLFAQINTGAEPQKAGVLPEAADAFLKKCADVHGLKISGLMCIPPAEEAPGPHFALTAKIARRNGLKLLSMGMSADFADAILLGATHVRVGSAIFGGR
ncbi:MAG: YggS family pyridoxal phosphate-dependent enzyme [Pseudolabrys sp.]|nr:YggS family pyridoxal phosphate-dependent enzyme [Pseudolabrys sp.]